ncbi:hypothetical protein C8F01DRAFT_1262840 [Mycena amicta]|nr:hypothetical protein C8F01DRAFT_1262840 [Mycena amicta]
MAPKRLCGAEKKKRRKLRAREEAEASEPASVSTPDPVPSPNHAPSVRTPPTPSPLIDYPLSTPIYIHPHARRHPLHPSPLQWMASPSPPSSPRTPHVAFRLYSVATVDVSGTARDLSSLRGTRPWRNLRRRQRRLRRSVRLAFDEYMPHQEATPVTTSDLVWERRHPNGTWDGHIVDDMIIEPQSAVPAVRRVTPAELLLAAPALRACPDDINISSYSPLPPPLLCPFPAEHVPPPFPAETRYGPINSAIAFACVLALPPPQESIETIAEVVWPSTPNPDGTRSFPFLARLDVIPRLRPDVLVFVAAIAQMVQLDDTFGRIFKHGVEILLEGLVDEVDRADGWG